MKVIKRLTPPMPETAQPSTPPFPSIVSVCERDVRRKVAKPWLIVLLLAGLLAFAGCASSISTPTPGASNGTGPAPTVAVPAAAADLEQTVQTVIQRVQPSVVEVQSSGSQGQSIGSGEVIAADGFIVTNDHVVRGFQRYDVVLATGQTLPARLVGEAPGDDLAVLKVSATGLRPINLGDSNAVRVGTFVLAIGSPLGLDQSATFGIVSALNRSASEAPDGPAAMLTGLIQTSAPINPGNSGGALVNLRAELIGIPTLGAGSSDGTGAASGIGFAISSNRVKFITEQLIKSGRVTSTGQGFLGITGTDVTPDMATTYGLPVENGVLISDFVSDAQGKSPAEQAGLRRGDIILEVNQTQVTGNGALAGILLSLAPGTRVDVTLRRGSSQQRISVTLGERPTQ